MTTITLELPDNFYKPLQRISKATQNSIELVLMTALQASLPSLEGLSPELEQALIHLESLDNDSLRQFLLKTVPFGYQQEIETLLQQNKLRALNQTEQERLAFLQNMVDKITLQKARAAVLLRFRGQRLPTLAELRRLTTHE
jgi:energy-converting hydrogenase A subunit M